VSGEQEFSILILFPPAYSHTVNLAKAVDDKPRMHRETKGQGCGAYEEKDLVAGGVEEGFDGSFHKRRQDTVKIFYRTLRTLGEHSILKFFL
jgi:hypothetical protein